MKNHGTFLLFCALMFVMYSGCSIPTMTLQHNDSVDSTYENMGHIKISAFSDRRPEEERDEDQIAMNSLSAQIWSGATVPGMMQFFQQSLIEEAERSRLYTVDDGSELELSGYVTSMKVDRRVTAFRYLGLVPLIVGFATDTPENNNALIGVGGFLLVLAFDSPILTATIDYHAVLKRNGSTIFEKNIKLVKEDRYWGMGEWSWDYVSNQASDVLDEAITESIQMLFNKIVVETASMQPEDAPVQYGKDNKTP